MGTDLLSKKPSWLASAFIEMVMVVASNLIAFSRDAWWDGQKERSEEQEVLAALLAEFREVEDEIMRLLVVVVDG